MNSLPTTRPNRVPLAGFGFDPLTETEVVDGVMEALGEGRGGWIVPANLDVLRQFRHSAEAARFHRAADLVVADGMPLIWASRLQETPLPERVAGSNLIWSLSAAAARERRRVFLLGGDPGAGEKAAERLAEACPGLAVAGLLSPPYGFERSEQERERIAVALAGARPDLVFVALGFPKQERLIAELREAHPRAWFIGVGISLSFIAGEVVRAPGWMQRAGLEWVHRLVQEPGRLFRRYVIEDLPFAATLFRGSLRRRLGRGPAAVR